MSHEGDRARSGPDQWPFAVGPVDAVALLVELAALVLLGCLGWRLGSSLATRTGLALVLVVVAGVVWGLFASPRARFPSLTGSIATKVVVLGASVVAAVVLLPVWLALVYAAVVVADTVLLYVGPWARPYPERAAAGSTTSG